MIEKIYSVYNAYKGPKQIWTGTNVAHCTEQILWNQCMDQLMSSMY